MKFLSTLEFLSQHTRPLFLMGREVNCCLEELRNAPEGMWREGLAFNDCTLLYFCKKQKKVGTVTKEHALWILYVMEIIRKNSKKING